MSIYPKKDDRRARIAVRIFQRVILWIVVFGVMTLLAAGLLSYERPTVIDELNTLEAEVGAMLAQLADSSPRHAPSLVAQVNRRLARMHERLMKRTLQADTRLLTNQEVDQIERILDDMGRLRLRMREWEQRLDKATDATLDEVWVAIVIDVLRERAIWPFAAMPSMRSRIEALDHWRTFRQGLVLGGAWPVRVIRNAVAGPTNRYGRVRRMFFPFGTHSPLRVLHVLGFGLAAIGVGYACCWIGLWRNNASMSFIGLIYFLYVIVFGICLISLQTGILN